VSVEERHKPLLVEGAAACSGTRLSDASGIAAVEQPVLQVHVPADRRLRRRHERLGIDGLTTAGSGESISSRLLAFLRLLALLFAFLLRFLGLVLDQLLLQLFQPPDPLLKRLLGLLVGYDFKRGAAQQAG